LIVLDASAGVPLLVGNVNLADRVFEVLRPHGSVAIPEVFDLEVLNALRRMLRSGEIGRDVAEGGLASLDRMRVQRYSHQSFRRRIWELRDSVTPYDAAYVTLAADLRVPLLTLDLRLLNSPVAGKLAEIITV
jgi:predicted nucleic acid-binding protein